MDQTSTNRRGLGASGEGGIQGNNQKRETIWVRSLPSLVEYQGSPAVAGNAVDITEEKKMEKKLQAERDLFETIMTLSPDLVYFKDDQHRFERAR